MEWLNGIDWSQLRADGIEVFIKLVRTKDAGDAENDYINVSGGVRLSRCLTTSDLTSLGVGSCVGTGMYLVSGMVARRFAGPGVIFSFMFAALASLFSGACYAEFGVRVPNTTGSAYMYSYVAVGEFTAFIIGWNLILEYMIGTSACGRALSACFDSLYHGAISKYMAEHYGTVFGKPPDLLASGICIGMMTVLAAGVKKSLLFNNILNSINLVCWVFIMGAGMFYVDFDNWFKHDGFLPYGWSGVFSGAATCFYAFIGFDIIATTGEEANNPKRSIPLAILMSLCIILMAYVSTSIMLTLIVPYNEIDVDSALVQMFGHVHAPICKYIVAIGALAGLTVSMFGSMFPMPRIIYAMASDGLIFKNLAKVSKKTGTPILATIYGGLSAALVSLIVPLEVLVEMMSIGTLLAYTLVSTCVLVLRYQPYATNLIELLPQTLRTPVDPPATGGRGGFSGFHGELSRSHLVSSSQHVMVRRVTRSNVLCAGVEKPHFRSSPDSDDTMHDDESPEYGREDAFLVPDRTEFYVSGTGSSGTVTRWSCFMNAVSQKLQILSYVCPGFFPWTDRGPATVNSGMFVIKAVGLNYVLIIMFNIFAAYGSPGDSAFCTISMVLLFVAIMLITLIISRKPQNRAGLMYLTPCLPFVPMVAIMVNIYLILNLSILTLVRFAVWMAIGMVVYFKYGIKNSTLEAEANVVAPTPSPQPSLLDRITLPPAPPTQARTGDRNIFEGDGRGMGYGNDGSQLEWYDSSFQRAQLNRPSDQRVCLEQRYNERTNTTTSHVSKPNWNYQDGPAYDDGSWDD